MAQSKVRGFTQLENGGSGSSSFFVNVYKWSGRFPQWMNREHFNSHHCSTKRGGTPPNCGMSEVTQKRLLLGIWKWLSMPFPWRFYGISMAFPWLGSRWLASPRIPRCLRFHDFDPGGAWSHFEGHGVLDRVQRMECHGVSGHGSPAW